MMPSAKQGGPLDIIGCHYFYNIYWNVWGKLCECASGLDLTVNVTEYPLDNIMNGWWSPTVKRQANNWALSPSSGDTVFRHRKVKWGYF